MAEPSIYPLVTGESNDEALDLVKRDLESSDKFKREYCPTSKVQIRRRMYEGDPEAYEMPYDSDWGARLVNNWMLRQINHKVGKLSRSPTRLNLSDSTGKNDLGTRYKLIALKHRLERKARESNWPLGRRLMLLDAAKVGFGVRCLGVQFDRGRYLIRNWRVRAEEYHQDPTAEGIEDAEWTSWRRPVTSSRLTESLARHKDLAPLGAGAGLVPDMRPADINLSDDRILWQGRGVSDRGTSQYGVDPVMVTDYYRRDQTQDYYYPCEKCGRFVGASRARVGDKVGLMFKCPACKYETPQSRRPSQELIKRIPRYPNGRHIRLLGNVIDYRGPNRYKLEDVHPFVFLQWYQGEVWPGISEIQQLGSAQIYDNVVMNMLSDNAFSGAHSKLAIPIDGISSGWNNNSDFPIEVSDACWAGGGPKPIPPGSISDSVRILSQVNRENLFLLAANSPESQGQAPETLRSGVGFRAVVAASDVGLYLSQEALIRADQRFFRLTRDLCAMFDSSAEIAMVGPDGVPGSYAYDRSLMTPNISVEVRTDRDVDAEREELYTRALEMRQMGVSAITEGVLLELSGIPEDIIQRAQMEARAEAAKRAAMAGGIAPDIGNGSAAPPVPATNGGGMGGPLPPAIAARLGGARAPTQTRPPSRSRGALPAGVI